MIKVVKNLASTVVTVTTYVLPTVKITLVTFNVEIATHVNQDGMGQLVTKHVKTDGMVKTAVNNALDIVETGLHVIT